MGHIQIHSSPAHPFFLKKTFVILQKIQINHLCFQLFVFHKKPEFPQGGNIKGSGLRILDFRQAFVFPKGKQVDAAQRDARIQGLSL